MDRVKNAWGRIAGYVACVAARLSRRTLLVVVGLLSAGFLWAVALAPTVVAFVLTVGLAAAWCAWLDKNPEASLETTRSTDDDISAGTPPGLPVHVLATTHHGTTSALTIAKELAATTPARVVLIVPRLTSFATPFNPTGSERTALIDGYRNFAAEVGVHVSVLFCVCHRLDDVVHLLGSAGLLIVGGCRRGLWPSREQRLVTRLVGEGYRVVFADIGARYARPARASVRCS